MRVTVQPVPWSCRRHRGPPVDAAPIYVRLPDKADGRIYLCLQLPTESALVRVEGAQALSATTQLDAGVIALASSIASALRPPAVLIGLGASIQPRLAVTTTTHGFDVHGLDVRPRFQLRVVPGTCGMAPAARKAPKVLWPRSAAGRLPLRGDARRVTTCFERRDDAVEVTIDEPALIEAPVPEVGRGAINPPTQGPPTLDDDLADVLAALVATVEQTDLAPRIYAVRGPELTLPRSRLTLRTSHATGGGWVTTSALRHDFKLVDGAAWGEPVADMLLPIRPYRYAVAVRRGPCAYTTPATSPLVPAALGPVRIGGVGPGWRTRVCVGGQIVVTILHVGTPSSPSSTADVRAVVTDIARAAGMTLPGPEFQVRGVGFFTIGMVWPEGGGGPSSAGALRARSRYVVGRPGGFAAEVEGAIGAGGGAFQPGSNTGQADVIGELRVGIGGAWTTGRWTAAALISADWDSYWPDSSWLRGALSLSVDAGPLQAELRYTGSALRPAHALDLLLIKGRYAAMFRSVTFPGDEPTHTEAGRPRLGVEIGLGIAM
jgi:hypothetical protein